MKSKPQNPPKSTGPSGTAPAGDPNAGDPEDLRAMWSAVAALLDDTTVGAPPTTASYAPPAMASTPISTPKTASSPAPTSSPAPLPANGVTNASPALSATPAPSAPNLVPSASYPAPVAPNPAVSAPTPKPVTPARTNPLFGSRGAQPPVNTPPNPPASAPPTANPSFGAPPNDLPTPDAPNPNAPQPDAPKARNGDALVPPYAPGAGPQILPAPDGYLNTPPLPAEPQPPVLPRQPGEPFILPDGLDTHSVSIRGRNDGVGVEIGDGAWRDLLYVLSYRIEQTDGFFRGNHIAVDVGGRHLNENDLNQMRYVMRSFGLDPSLLRTSSERTFQAALALSIPVSQVSVDGSPVNEAVPAQSEAEGLGFFVYRGSLRSGQVLYRREHIIVIGDVNPGAEVVSDGDIMVWGRLRGIAHAGARGNTNAIITALDLDPVQLRIDQVIGAAQAGISSNGPRWGASRSAERKAELARLINGKLTIQQWDEAKSGGVALLKRKLF